YEFMRHFLPWLPLLFIALYFFFRRKGNREKSYSLLLLIFGTLPIIILSFTGDKAARYILFTYPVFLLFTALNIFEKVKPEVQEKLMVTAIVILVLLSAYVIIRPIDLTKIENEDYIILEQDIEEGRFTPGNTDLFHFGIDYNGNMRALIYYTGIKMRGLLTDVSAVQKRAEDKEPFYLIVENRDYKNENYFKTQMRVLLNLKNRKILMPKL
ncbi:MAG: hypothetical protein JW737_01995, partial [Acidobacteria bacterium]|nr:hypothetical protein [Acidobacteriota bacterium]